MPLSTDERRQIPNRGDFEDLKTAIESLRTTLQSGVDPTLARDTTVQAARDRLPASVGAKPTASSLAVALPTDLAALQVRDRFTAGEVQSDFAGANAVQDFAFAPAVQLVWVHAIGGEARADPFGGVPSAIRGVRCLPDVPTPIFVETSLVKVYIPSGVTVTVYGMRY